MSRVTSASGVTPIYLIGRKRIRSVFSQTDVFESYGVKHKRKSQYVRLTLSGSACSVHLEGTRSHNNGRVSTPSRTESDKMAATPFLAAVSSILSLVNVTTTNADAPLSDLLGPQSRIERMSRRLPPTPSFAPASSSLPAMQPLAGVKRPWAGRKRLTAPVCWRCNGHGKCLCGAGPGVH